MIDDKQINNKEHYHHHLYKLNIRSTERIKDYNF